MSFDVHICNQFSDEPQQKTYNKILNEYVEMIEDMSKVESICKFKFLKELQERCTKKWGPSPTQESQDKANQDVYLSKKIVKIVRFCLPPLLLKIVKSRKY